MTISRLLLLAFILDALALMIGEVLFDRTLIIYTKPLLMPLLGAWLWTATRSNGTSGLRSAWLAGLAFSTLGDTLLMFTGKSSGGQYFLMGLGAFLLAHGCYILGLRSLMRRREGFIRKNPWVILPFAVYLLGLLAWIWPDVPVEMRVPVAVYAIVITVMALSVVDVLYGYVATSVFSAMMAGALLFVLSDSLIAVSKFGHPFAGSRIAVMATYIVGQWLMAKSVAEIDRAVRPTQ